MSPARRRASARSEPPGGSVAPAFFPPAASLPARAEEQGAPDAVFGAVRSLPEQTGGRGAGTLGYGEEERGQG